MDLTIITVRNWTMTLEHGLVRTWRLPLLLALLMLLIAPVRTFMRTIMAALKNGGKRTGGVKEAVLQEAGRLSLDFQRLTPHPQRKGLRS